MSVTIEWRGDQWQRAVVPSINAGLAAAAMVMADQAVRNFGTEGGGVVGASTSPLAGGPVTGRANRGRGARRYYPAPPGAFPGVRTANLRRSIAFASPDALGTPLHAAYGTAVRYGRNLEFGTSKMPARPWAIRSALMARQRARAVFTRVSKERLMAAGLVKRG